MIEMRSALPLLVLIAGCDLVYGLEERVATDAAPEADAAIEPDAPDAPPSCSMFSATVVVSADTMLIRDNTGNCDPSNRQGAGPNVNVGQPSMLTRSRVLLRFSLTDEIVDAIAPGGGFTGGTLTLPLKPDACAAPCPSTALGFSIFAANNDWNEGLPTGHIGAAWCVRKQLSTAPGTPWQMQGADGVMAPNPDRSATSLADVTITPAVAMQDEIEIPFGLAPGAVDDLRMWVSSQQISLLLVPTTTTGQLFIKAREAAGGGAQLTIRGCR
jgi:hypothetical protein